MLLYPILCPKQWSELSRRGRLTGQWRYIDQGHERAFRWMVAQMLRRGIDTRGHPPVWAWHSYDPPKRCKPDLRSSYYLTTPGTRAVRLVIDAPKELVLLSDFFDWHAVLNGTYLSLSEQEDRRIERKYPIVPRRVLQSSWIRIFDLTCDTAWRGKRGENPIQACLPYIDGAWIKEATPFKARGRPAK